MTVLTTSSVFSFCAQILVGELCAFFTKAEGTQEKTIVTADCCYFNPLLRRIIRFLGEHTALCNAAPSVLYRPVKGHFCVLVCGSDRESATQEPKDQSNMKEKVDL